MFTGIVSELGLVTAIDDSTGVVRLVIEAPVTVEGLQAGDSVAVNGVCLTAVSIDGAEVAFDAVPETMSRTSLSDLQAGVQVNLERPTAVGGRFDGHIVQGHVDGVGEILETMAEADSTRIRCSVPDGLAHYLVEKGSIAVDGTSLTVTAVSAVGAAAAWFEFVVIPHTLEVTTLGDRSPGQRVNLEVDVIAKYVERMLGAGT